ncbi:DUF2867 domain-containing protein [Vibrio cholerae]|uniref:DUF2867 domain-containing protein n=1 Tax=Vibrio cholerae TaxID=666 RepID=UPI001C3061D4
MKKVLVLGASGYVGAQLLPLLLEAGYHTTAASRHIETLHARLPTHPNLTRLTLDLADRQKTLATIPNYDLVFFLVHGMAHGGDFVDYELSLAQNVKDALDLAHSQVQHVIYLSSLQPESGRSPHLQARYATGQILRQSRVPITELRAGVIIGSGSAAFEIMRDFVYNLPVLITPKWVDSQANPIALANLNPYLLKFAEEQPKMHQTFELGGPDVLSYREQFQILCELTGKPYRLWSTRFLTPSMAARWLGMVTSVPSSIGRSLLEGLTHDFIADTQAIEARYPQPLIAYREAVKAAISSEGTFVRSQVWGFDPHAIVRWQPGFGYYPKQAGASIETELSSHELWKVIRTIGRRDQGYFFANILWRTREWLDVLFGGGKPIRRYPAGAELAVGDYIDSWKVIRCQPQQFLSLLFGMKGPGLGRLEFTIDDLGDKRRLNVTAWWHPQGFLGLMYWYAMMPAHLFIFRGMVKAIIKKSRRD